MGRNLPEADIAPEREPQAGGSALPRVSDDVIEVLGDTYAVVFTLP